MSKRKEIKMPLPKTLISKSFINDYGNKIHVSIVHRPAGFDGHSDRPEAWIVRIQRNNDVTYHGQAYRTKIEAANAYNEIN
jgi:hypothetical protein